MNAIAVVLLAQAAVAPHAVAPVLEFPEAGVDDGAAYEGYRTRFYRDAAGNAFQIYLDGRSGRVVHVWANALNESAAFTARGEDGRPARLEWGGVDAWVSAEGERRAVEYELAARSPVELGLFLLGSMRVERDFQYARGHLGPFGGAAFQPEELVRLIEHLRRLDGAERREHLRLLGAGGVDELRSRLAAGLSLEREGGAWVVRAEQPSFDGRNRMALEVVVAAGAASLDRDAGVVAIRPAGGGAARLRVRVTTDAAALAPLTRGEIFNAAFRDYVERERERYERALAVPEPARGPEERARILRYRRMERELRAAELLGYREKLMAGLPNYATYFGRDMLMTALMMEPVWTDAMQEHVIAAVLRKLSPAGEVSHEEALGGQAIRENAAEYGELLAAYFGGGAGRDTLLARARAVLADLRAVRENYRMVDDDYQFPVVVARYLGKAAIPAARKRAFLEAPAAEGGGETRLARLLRNLAHVARATSPYARDPRPENLIAFPKRGPAHWFSGSWRDSGPGYANGRFAMDVNAIWAPAALAALDTILTSLRSLGYDAEALERVSPGMRGGELAAYARDPESLRRAARVWRGAAAHFEVTLSAREVEARVAAKLAWLPGPEGRHWERVLRADPLAGRELTFLALALDSAGRPIPVASTDPAMGLFLEDRIGAVLSGATTPERAFGALRVVLLPYPVGLLIDGVGPVAANDAYAGREVWEAFTRDRYHSPSTIWGREVNLLLLGLARQIEAAFGEGGALRDPALAPAASELSGALQRILEAVEASGFKHAEVWSYRVAGGRVSPVRYATSADIQLWNVTELAVQYRLARLRSLDAVPAPVGGQAIRLRPAQ